MKDEIFASICVVFIFGGILFSPYACSQRQASSAVNIAVKVTDQLCKEEASDPAEPDWIKLACVVEGGIVHVAFPRSAWAAMHPRTLDRDY